MESLSTLSPQLIWKHFSAICSIPHPSGYEKRLVQYIQDFSESLGLPHKTDRTGNILVSKKSAAGKSDKPGVILQSHLDMVPQKNDGTVHDFTHDPIIPFIDGEWVKAQNTTLGADNGIGVAIMLAVLESKDINHGPIEALFTIDEETGMTGAIGLENGFLNGKKLINIDTEEEGEFCIGCAGGVNGTAVFHFPEEQSDYNAVAFTIGLRGLKGGHSGIDIHLGRGNAIKLLNRLLFQGEDKYNLRISELNGGSVRNAIPREAFATVIIPDQHNDKFLKFLLHQEQILQSELSGVEDSLRIDISRTSIPEKILTLPAQNNLFRAIYSCPNGVIRMSSQINGVVETSNNLAIAKYSKGVAHINCLLRSSIDTSRKDLEAAVYSALSLAGANVEFSGDYPGWQPNPESELLKIMSSVYKQSTGREPDIKVVHAGLECGIIGSKYPGIEMVSCGPTIEHPHSPDERVNIKSVERFWNYFRNVLESL